MTETGSRTGFLKRWIDRWLPWLKPPPPVVPRPELWPKVQKILLEYLDAHRSQITPTAHLTDDLGMDSLQAIETVMAIEEEFGIEIPDAEAEPLKTVHELLQLIEEKLQHAPPSSS